MWVWGDCLLCLFAWLTYTCACLETFADYILRDVSIYFFVFWGVNRVLQWYFSWLERCCYAIAMVFHVVHFLKTQSCYFLWGSCCYLRFSLKNCDPWNLYKRQRIIKCNTPSCLSQHSDYCLRNVLLVIASVWNHRIVYSSFVSHHKLCWMPVQGFPFLYSWNGHFVCQASLRI